MLLARVLDSTCACSQVFFAALWRSHSRALRWVFSRAALPCCALLYMRYMFYMLEMEARWFRPLRASLSAMHTTSRPQYLFLFLFLTRFFSFSFSFLFFFSRWWLISQAFAARPLLGTRRKRSSTPSRPRSCGTGPSATSL